MDFLEDLEKTKLREEKIEAHRKLKEQLKNDPSSVPEKTENLLKKYTNLTPLNFVNTIETLYHTIIHNTKFDALHTLSSYKSIHNIKFDLLDFELKEKVSKKIAKKIKGINCIKVTEDILFTGENDGSIYLYKIENGEEFKNFSSPQFNSPVSALENKGTDYLLVGYEDGTINLYDIKKGLLNSFKDLHKSKIIALKFAILEKHVYKFVSSDEEGLVLYLNFSSKYSNLKKKATNDKIYQDSEPTYAITKFSPYDNKNISILAFASINKVKLYSLEPKLELKFELKKPEYTEENDIPDISLGWGNRPLPQTGTKKLSECIEKREIFLAVAWGNVISFYVLTIKGDTFTHEGPIAPIGFFENNISIIRLGFISSSIIYFFDKTAQLKIINTSFCDFGKYEKIEDKKFVYNKNALIDEGKIIDPHMKNNNVSKNKNRKLLSYRNFIYNMKKSIYIVTEEGLRIGKVLSYKDCIEDIIAKTNNWFDAMCLAIDIYQGNITSFPDIPPNEKERKEKLKPYLIELLNKYIDYNFKGAKESTTDEELDEDIIDMRDDQIIECINVSIEFCLGIKIFDYLLKDVERTFSKYGKGDLFYKLLEPFIFNDLLIQEKLNESALTSLYGAYEMKKELVLLSHLFIHINLKCLTNFTIKKLAIKENLFSLLIFIFSNGSCYEDFFLPITKMYQIYLKEYEKSEKEKENKKNDEKDENKFFNYCEIYGEKGIKGINEMERCKEYIGHKLLWYIEQCLKGNKFASGIDVDFLKFQMSSDNYKKFVATIYFWILQENIFLTLLKFDSYSFFSVLNLFFTETKIMNIIQDFDFSTITSDKLQKLIEDQENNTYFLKDMANFQNEMFQNTNKDKVETKKDTQKTKNEKNKEKGNKEKENKEKGNKEKDKDKEKDKKEKGKDEDKETPGEQESKNDENKDENVDEDGDKKDSNKNEIPNQDANEEENHNKIFNPFSNSKYEPKFGKGLKLNNLHNVLLYIIEVTESQNSYLSHQDLNTFLIRFASKYPNPSLIPELTKAKIFEGFKNCLKFFSEYKNIRNDLINNNEDKFNCHSLSKKTIDNNDYYFSEISKCLSELLDSEIYKFTKEELNELIKVSSKTPFTMIKIKIAELSKNYTECLNIFFQNKTEKLQDDVFAWLDKKFSSFSEILEEEKNKLKEEENEDGEKVKKEILPEMKDRATIAKENRLNQLREDLNNLRTVVIEKIPELAKMRLNKTNKLVGRYFLNLDKLNIIEKLSSTPELQFEFLNQLLNPANPSYEILNEEEITDKQYNAYFDLMVLFKKLTNKERENVRDKKIQEHFENILIQQISLLINLKRTNDILRFLKINIKLYPNYPLRQALKICMNNDITDSSIFLYQSLGESKNALYLTKKSLEKAFYNYIKDDLYDDKTEFVEKLKICIDICKENSESLTKKDIDDEGKETHKEGEDLWFNLLENLYKFEDECEKNEIHLEDSNEIINISEYRKKKVKDTLQKNIEELLQQMCLFVSIQNLVEYVTENQNRAQYKEFKCILESMLRTNTSFDRVLNTTMTILKRAINNSENERRKITLQGNNYNYKKCDVCKEFFENSKNEIILCFGCGHQSHQACCYKKKLKKDEISSEEENYTAECLICHQNDIEEVENGEKGEARKEIDQNEVNIVENLNENRNKNKNKEKGKKFKFGNKNEKFNKILRYDKMYEDGMSMFY